MVGFCYSPVCQLASANDMRTVVEYGGTVEPTSEQEEAYEEAVRRLSGLEMQKEFKINDLVKIT